MSFSLLSLPAVTLTTSTTTQHGTLSMEWISQADGTTVLALHVNFHTFRIAPGSHVTLLLSHAGERDYTFQQAVTLDEKGSERGKVAVKITIPPPDEDNKHVVEDIGTFDQLLTQYAELSWSYSLPETKSPVPPPLPARGVPVQTLDNEHHANIKESVEEHKPVEDPSLRGRLVLMDDSNGDVLGELPQTMHITEDAALPGKADNASPVVLELQPDMYDAVTGARPLGSEGEELLGLRDVFVRAVPPEEQDWMMKGATMVSQAISSSTSVLLSGITSASNYYIAHSQPGTRSRSSTPTGSGTNSPTIPPSPSATNTALSRVHNVSGQARAVTSKTADMVGDMIRRAMGGKADPPPATSSPTFRSASPLYQGPPPPYAVYTPKVRPQPPPTNVMAAERSSTSIDGKPAEMKPLKRLDKVVMSANLVLTTIDDSARRMFEVSSDRLGAVVGHKYGADAQQSTHLTMHTARNVVLVYVDMRGFARRALLKKTGKEFVKARIQNNKAQKEAGASSGAAAPAHEKT